MVEYGQLINKIDMGKALRETSDGNTPEYPTYQVEIAVHILQNPEKMWEQYLLLGRTLEQAQNKMRQIAQEKGEDPKEIKLSRSLPSKIYRSTPGLGLTPDGKKRSLQESPDMQMDTVTVIHLVNTYEGSFETMEDLLENARIIAGENAPKSSPQIKKVDPKSGSYPKADPLQEVSNDISEEVARNSSYPPPPPGLKKA